MSYNEVIHVHLYIVHAEYTIRKDFKLFSIHLMIEKSLIFIEPNPNTQPCSLDFDGKV